MGFDSEQARFLMVTAITHHRFSSSAWGEQEIRKLHAELAEIDASAARQLVSAPARRSLWQRVRSATSWRWRPGGKSRSRAVSLAHLEQGS